MQYFECEQLNLELNKLSSNGLIALKEELSCHKGFTRNNVVILSICGNIIYLSDNLPHFLIILNDNLKFKLLQKLEAIWTHEGLSNEFNDINGIKN